VDDGEAEADDDADGGGIRDLARGAENGEDEQGGQDDLGQEGAARVDVDVVATPTAK
jgi:hypothetical protein